MLSFFMCAGCENKKAASEFSTMSVKIAGRGKRCFCKECAKTKPYSTANVESVHKQAKHGFRFGCELECVPYSEGDKLAMTSSKYHLIPTRDSSLPLGGIEFKTGIIQNVSGMKSMLRSFENHVDFTDEKCGQHINFSNMYMSVYEYGVIGFFADDLFGELCDYMRLHLDEVEKVCGRKPTEYCKLEHRYTGHGTWLNLAHCSGDEEDVSECRLEWRLAKVSSPNQYTWLIFMCREMLDCIRTNFIAYLGTDKDEHKTKLTARKLKEIFQKYADGEANCQKEKFNSRER